MFPTTSRIIFCIVHTLQPPPPSKQVAPFFRHKFLQELGFPEERSGSSGGRGGNEYYEYYYWGMNTILISRIEFRKCFNFVLKNTGCAYLSP